MKVILVDDEPIARDRLRQLLADFDDVDIVAEAGDGLDALRACAAHDPDLVLLDIAMPGVDGLEVARHLAAFEPRPAVVFCTAFDAHALSAFEAQAIDYLVKPVRPERLAAALERVRTFAAGRQHAEAAGGAERTHLCARLGGSLRLIDFDLSIPKPEQPIKTKHNPGTPAYMAPEQLQRQPIDHRVDIWAYGVTAYELLTNEKPFPGDTPDEILRRQLDRKDFRIPRELNPDIPAALERIVVKCLDTKVEKRYPFMSVLVRDLQAALYV